MHSITWNYWIAKFRSKSIQYEFILGNELSFDSILIKYYGKEKDLPLNVLNDKWINAEIVVNQT